MIELGSMKEGSSLIDELMELTSQSLCQLEIKEHFNIIKEIGRGKYGRAAGHSPLQGYVSQTDTS